MNCGELTNEEAAHTVVHEAAKAPTCNEDGNVEFWYCSDCGSCWLDEALTIQTNRRSVVLWERPAHEYFYACDAHCMNCGELTNEEAAHTLTHVDAVEPTCEATGNVEYWTCTDCGGCWDNEDATGMPLNRFTVIIPMVEHEYTYDCDKNCKNCGEESRPEADHKYSDPTCNEAAICFICGASTDESLGHEFENYVYNGDATCFADGTETANCVRNCGETHTRTAEGSKLTHSYTNYVSNNDATCFADGTKTASCDHGCGAEETVTAEGSKLTHYYTNYTSNGDATCTADGTKTATCDYGCGATYTQADTGSAKGHAWMDATTEAPKTCEKCGATEGEKLPEATPDVEPTPDPVPEKNHDECEVPQWQKFLYMIINFIRNLLGLPEQCVCGDEL